MNKKVLDKLKKEYQDLIDSPIEGVKIKVFSSDWQIWHVDIEGPKGSLYYGGNFKFVFKFPDSFPFKAPRIDLQTLIHHIYLDKEKNCASRTFKLKSSSLQQVNHYKVHENIIELKSILFYSRYLQRDILNQEAYSLESSNKQLYQQKINEVMVEEKFKEYLNDNILTFIVQRKHINHLLHTNPHLVIIDFFY